jgi:hypothetical protein
MSRAKPGWTAWFVHLHTNRVSTCVPRPFPGEESVTVEVQAKIRPMLVLYARHDEEWGDCYKVLRATTSPRAIAKPGMVFSHRFEDRWTGKVKTSLIDCSQTYDYSDVLRVDEWKTRRVPSEVFQEVRSKLQRVHRELMSESIIRNGKPVQKRR